MQSKQIDFEDKQTSDSFFIKYCKKMLIPKNVQKKSKNRPFSDENHRKFVFNYSFCFSYVDTNL